MNNNPYTRENCLFDVKFGFLDLKTIGIEFWFVTIGQEMAS